MSFDHLRATYFEECAELLESAYAQLAALAQGREDAETVHALFRAIHSIKGGGGALLREKIVAAASDRMIVIADDTKWVDTLGRFPLPVEVIPFGLAATQRAIVTAFAQSGVSGQMGLRKGKDGHVFATDGGHWIIDAHLGRIEDAPRLAGLLSLIPGVVEHGLFIGLASTAILAGAQGIRVVERR